MAGKQVRTAEIHPSSNTEIFSAHTFGILELRAQHISYILFELLWQITCCTHSPAGSSGADFKYSTAASKAAFLQSSSDPSFDSRGFANCQKGSWAACVDYLFLQVVSLSDRIYTLMKKSQSLHGQSWWAEAFLKCEASFWLKASLMLIQWAKAVLAGAWPAVQSSYPHRCANAFFGVIATGLGLALRAAVAVPFFLGDFFFCGLGFFHGEGFA